ncbi:glycosyltransferase [Leptolyngbya sp. DQ-M1]|uniref:glycosyltransferase n=1 Tax=Leptolyngbya sp. DQ-M1 TaxID=2933920 RepID=UPI003299B8A7
MPEISVIIPAFNSEKTVQETIRSVLNQTFTDFEVIVVDDGSKDSTLNVVSSVTDPRVKVFSYKNAGVSTSRNRGFAQATGEYVSFLDADDLWTPDKLEAQYKALQKNPQAAVAYSWVDYIDQNGKFFCAGNHVTASGNIYEKLLLHNLLENGSNPLIRRQAFADTGGFDPALSSVADWDMWLRLSAHYEFVAVPSPQVLYRVTAGSMSSNFLKLEAEGLHLIEAAFNQAPISLQHLKKRSLSALYRYLTFNSLGSTPSRQNGLCAARFLWSAIANDFSIVLEWKRMLIALVKIVAFVSLPPKQSQVFLIKTKQLFAR